MTTRLLLFFTALLCCFSARSQSVIFSEDFESGLGQFHQVSGQAGVNWYRGAAAGNGARWQGQQAAFVSATGTTYAPISNLNDATHLYCDITFPANTTAFYLRLDVRNQGQFVVYQAPTSFQPVGGSTPYQLPQVFSFTGSPSTSVAFVFSSLQIALNPALAGTTQRFIFTWTNRAALSELPAALDNVQIIAGALPPLAGSYLIDRQQPSAARSFTSFTEAIWALNAGGTSGPITFEVAPGQRFVEAPPALLGTNSHPVIFRRGTGAGANPAVQSESTGFYLLGASNLTFDGIDIVPGTVGPGVGYHLLSRDNVAACQHVTVRNCAIRLGSAINDSKAIYQHTSLYANQGLSDTSRVNGHIRYENITIDQAHQGIWLQSDHGNMPDYDVEISHVTIGTGASRSIGRTGAIGGTNGIYANRLNGLRVHDCVIQGLVGGNDQLCGINMVDVVGPRPTVIAGNRIQNLEYVLPAFSPASYTSIYGVQLRQSFSLASTGYSTPAADVQLFNNQVQQLYYSAAPTYSQPIGGAAAGLAFTLNNTAANAFLVANNTVALDNTATPGVGLLDLSLSCTSQNHGLVESLNNLLVATTPTSGRPSALLFHVDIPRNQAPGTATNLHFDHNNFVLTGATQNDVGHVHVEGTSTATPFVGHTLADWQALTRQENASHDLAPQFAPGSDLRPTNAALGRMGAPLPLVVTDLAGTTRLSPPDVGALEFSQAPLPTLSAKLLAEKLLAWPVPFTNELTVELPAALTGELQAELIDAMGRVALTQTLPAAGPTRQLTGLEQLVPGSYVLRLRSATGQQLRLRVAR